LQSIDILKLGKTCRIWNKNSIFSIVF